MVMQIQMFSESRIQLDREIKNHPALMKLLQKHPANEIEIRIAEVAAYCGILLDDYYYEKDFDNICELCYWELRKRREGSNIIMPH